LLNATSNNGQEMAQGLDFPRHNETSNAANATSHHKECINSS